MLSSKLHSSIGNTDRLYVDDVFSAYTYTGNGATQTINNGIDLAGKGGLVWLKRRKYPDMHMLVDSGRGFGSYAPILATDVSLASSSLGTFNITAQSEGFRLVGSGGSFNFSGESYASWTFRKAPKFFDVVTYTGNGASSRAIAHLLGQEVGMVITKAASTAGDWNTYHRSATGDLVLNSTAAQTGSKALVNSATTSTFTVSGAANTNAVKYVAYLFAHDTSADGIIQCGAFTTDGGYEAIVDTLGWEPQFLLTKSSSATGDWIIMDSARAFASKPANNVQLLANTSAAENQSGTHTPLATGFRQYNISTATANIYLAIRRPNKPPTTGTQVYNAIARTGTGGAATVTGVGFAPDIAFIKSRGTTDNPAWFDRLRGIYKTLTSNNANAEQSYSDTVTEFGVDGVTLGVDSSTFWVNKSSYSYINHFFRRAPGFFDVVCYTGTGVQGNKTRSHNLGTAPELIITKQRTGSSRDWHVNSSFLGSSTHYLFLNSGAAQLNWGGAPCLHTASTYDMPGDTEFNQSSGTYVSYLFASAPGISKVFNYTGNGSSQTINCGFTTGARFVLIKRTDSAGDWFVWDTARGIVSANDPHLSLNTTAAEVTTNDSVDPDSTGFIVNQVAATNINVTSATYIFLAVS